MKARKPEVIKLDPRNMQVARESSWMCELFQELKLNVQDKQDMIRSLTDDYKKSLLEPSI